MDEPGPANRRGGADAADLVPFGHPAHFLLVDGVGRGRDGASGGDGQLADLLLEHVLQALAPHPASLAAKLEAFAILSTTTALFVQNELGGGSARQQRNAAYLNHALATGRYPQLADLLAPRRWHTHSSATAARRCLNG